jgi:hypothetical protein
MSLDQVDETTIEPRLLFTEHGILSRLARVASFTT